MRDDRTEDIPYGEYPRVTREMQARRFEAFLLALCEMRTAAAISGEHSDDVNEVGREKRSSLKEIRKTPLTD